MQVFLPYDYDLKKSAISLDNKRLNKQIVEICQILSIQYNKMISKTKSVIGHSNHPVVINYDNKDGKSYLIEYGFKLCEEYSYRFDKVHQSYFTLQGLKLEYSNMDLIYDWKYKKGVSAYIKGQKNKDGVTCFKNVSKLYQSLLIEKWESEQPQWRRRDKPDFLINNVNKKPC